MKAIKRQEKVKSMAIKLFRLNYARDLVNDFFNFRNVDAVIKRV